MFSWIQAQFISKPASTDQSAAGGTPEIGPWLSIIPAEADSSGSVAAYADFSANLLRLKVSLDLAGNALGDHAARIPPASEDLPQQAVPVLRPSAASRNAARMQQ